ncbi:MAG: 1,4-alpha-glucan branching protein GlgB [Oscillospiraceae bacterium]
MDKKTKELLEDFHRGTCIRAYELLGCHRTVRRGKAGYVFRVWAPNAKSICVVGEFNFWNQEDLPMERLERGVWEVFTTRGYEGCPYKYYIVRPDGTAVYKADPYGTRAACLPDTSSLICTEEKHTWGDGRWIRDCSLRSPLTSPMNIYEMHLGSWRRKEDGSVYTYAELAGPLTTYLKDMGYTHVEFMPLSEYPYDPSWGYQVTGYYAPTFRYGEPEGLRTLVDTLHRAGIGVILDWVPAHFPKDEQGLYEFDGSCCYELSDPSMNEHPEWTTRIFDFGKPEVKSFLVSNVVYWLEKFHIDGLRVDAVSSMLYLDYGRTHYKPNRFGGRENLEAMELLRAVNRAAFSVRPNALMVAEESTSFPMITKPDFDGGLGFLFKWNMGWMNDTIRYMQTDPIYRKYKHNSLTFSMTYAFSENFILPLSHDEVVHGKASLINKMPGEYDQKFSNLRAMYAYMMAHPGKKLSFMGNEFAQFIEWRYAEQLDWLLLDYDRHRQMQSFVRDLNHFYLSHAQFWQNEQDWDGFQWIQPDAGDDNLLAFRRIDRRNREVLVICNFCPVERLHYRLGVPRRGIYKPVLCSDSLQYGGSGTQIHPAVSERVSFRDYKLSACFDIPPMSTTFYVRENPSKSTAQAKKVTQEAKA